MNVYPFDRDYGAYTGDRRDPRYSEPDDACECPACSGDGIGPGQCACQWCDGRGWVSEDQAEEIQNQLDEIQWDRQQERLMERGYP